MKNKLLLLLTLILFVVDGCEFFAHEPSMAYAVLYMFFAMRECVHAYMCVQLLL